MNRTLTDCMDQLHTTESGAARIRRNLALSDMDPVEFCRARILDPNAAIYKRGKNWYARSGGVIVTVNAGSGTIITAHPDRQALRIAGYEDMLDEAQMLLTSGRTGVRLSGLIRKLDAYYQSPRWKRDFADDEAGLLPRDLKRGVLSEDGIYNLMDRFDHICIG